MRVRGIPSFDEVRRKAVRSVAGFVQAFGIRSAPFFLAIFVLAAATGKTDADDGVDTALIVSVDVSQSVDESRYRLQMEGIAAALEDPGVVAAITSGPRGSILFSMIAWADRADLVLGWRRIASQADATAVAAAVRNLPQKGGEFTCMARMLRTVAVSILPSIPIPAGRLVVDVSGDGIDNCSPKDEMHAERDAVIAAGATINGLPIIVEGENTVVGSGAYRPPGYGLQELSSQPDLERTTLDAWFKENVVGGDNAFVLPAHGYDDFGRAFRRKFVSEISRIEKPDQFQFVARDTGTVTPLRN